MTMSSTNDATTSPEPATASAEGTVPEPVAAAPAVEPAGTVLAADDTETHDGETDSTFGETETTASISSSIQSYRMINGRRYHSDRFDTQYWGSNDDRQNEVLDIMHHFMLLSLDGALHKVPLDADKIQKVVDIGTGTGIWAIDFADVNPKASVIGTDISPIQPAWVPPNLEFQIDDCSKPWTFQADSLDFIHVRWMIGSISNWEAFFSEAYRCLKPGGWIESVEPTAFLLSDDGTLPEDTHMRRWANMFVDAGKKMGRPFTVVEDDLQRKGMAAAGFSNVQQHRDKLPVGPWPSSKKYKEIGTYVAFGLDQDIEGVMMMVATLVGLTKEEVAAFAAQFRKEMHSGKHHAYYGINYVWAQKPLSA